MLPRIISQTVTRRFSKTLLPSSVAATSWIRSYGNDRSSNDPRSFTKVERNANARGNSQNPIRPTGKGSNAAAGASSSSPRGNPPPDGVKLTAKRGSGEISKDQERARHSQDSVPPPKTHKTASKDDITNFSRSQEEFSGPSSPDANDAASHPADTRESNSEQPPINRTPLPDLRQGIPSTFDAEYGAGRSRQTTGELELVEKSGRGGEEGRRGGELPKSAYETSQDRFRSRFANYMYASIGLFALTGTAYLGREWESEKELKAHPNIPSGWAPGSIYERAKARLNSQIDVFTEPSFPKLLPDIDPAPPFTLVVSLEDLLIHSEWSREHGWRMAKRPGVDYFLRYLSQYYELVVFTSLPFASADPVIRKLDPFRIIMWPLAREATRYENGVYIKDLAHLNRDLSKVILIDTDPAHAKRQPENAIILDPWTGDRQDRELVGLIPFLEHVATMGIEDTRKVLKSFEGKQVRTEFAAREARAREAFNKQLAEERARRPKVSGLGMIASGLGIKSPSVLVTGEPTAAQGFEQGKMLSDQIRERGLKQYEAMEKEIRENGDKWLKEMEAEEKKMQQESMRSMKSGFKTWFGGAGEK